MSIILPICSVNLKGSERGHPTVAPLNIVKTGSGNADVATQRVTSEKLRRSWAHKVTKQT